MGHRACLVFQEGADLVWHPSMRKQVWECCYVLREICHFFPVWSFERGSWWGPVCRHYYLSRCEDNARSDLLWQMAQRVSAPQIQPGVSMYFSKQWNIGGGFNSSLWSSPLSFFFHCMQTCCCNNSAQNNQLLDGQNSSIWLPREKKENWSMQCHSVATL